MTPEQANGVLWQRLESLNNAVAAAVSRVNAQLEDNYGHVQEGTAATLYDLHHQLALPVAVLDAAVSSHANDITAQLGAKQVPVADGVQAVHDAVWLDLYGRVSTLGAAVHGGLGV